MIQSTMAILFLAIMSSGSFGSEVFSRHSGEITLIQKKQTQDGVEITLNTTEMKMVTTHTYTLTLIPFEEFEILVNVGDIIRVNQPVVRTINRVPALFIEFNNYYDFKFL